MNSSPNVTSSLTAPARQGISEEEIDEAINEAENEVSKETEIIDVTRNRFAVAKETAEKLRKLLDEFIKIPEDALAIFLEHYRAVFEPMEFYFFLEDLEYAKDLIIRIYTSIPERPKREVKE